MGSPLLAAVVTAMALIASCSNGSVDTGMLRSPTPTRTPPATSFVNGGDCPRASEAGLPADAGCVSSVSAGNKTVSVYALLGSGLRPKTWLIRLDSARGTIQQVLDAGNAYSYPRAVGASDIDGDGRPEWWVKVVDYTSHGAPWSGLRLFFTRKDALIPLALDEQPLTVNYGGIARLGEGAECRNGDLVLLRAEAKNRINTRWSVSERRLLLRGTSARLSSRKRSTLVITDYNDPALDRFYRVNCDGFVFP